MSSDLKRHLKGILLQAKGDCSDRVYSDQMVLGTARREAEPLERWAKALKTKLTQGGPADLSPLRSDGSCDGLAGVRSGQRHSRHSWKRPFESQET